MKPTDATMETLACEIDKRPKDAPSDHEVFALVTGIQRGANALTLTFAPAAASKLTAFVEAERQCCAGIGWDLVDGPEPGLRITATAAQLDLFEMMIASYQE